ncbi:FAD-dependent oxidoreductase [Rhodoferax sp.]|uniref:FAD-dependent oxidoreductase n=1 Tax=Rhodoferax sp. TaxID=50421 RepID=UPI00271778D3|nr:FAD-dependent oxidoreductase [Rhodoferax sp.]MDO9198158.1 FAD-dependent oxidoreductase [Rhodoferax sp.]
MNIVILGAGLMGRLLACQLARAGHSLELFDAGGPEALNSAARAAAAMLAPLAESAITETSVVQMGVHGLKRWPELIAQLDEPVFFQQEGTLVLWHRQDVGEAERFARQMDATCLALPSLPSPQRLDAEGVAQLEPSLGSRFAQGLFLPGEGQLDNHQLLAAMLHQLQRLNIKLNWDSPRSPSDFAPGNPGQPDWVFDCRGLGAREQWPVLRGVRGEIITLQAPEVKLTRPTRLIHPRYPIYIAPKGDGIFVLGATEIESDDRSPMSVRSTLELLSAAYSIDSGFAEARILDLVTQCRPALPDNLPSIRRLGERVMQINGLYRHGYLIAPALLDVVMELFTANTSPLASTFSLSLQDLQH